MVAIDPTGLTSPRGPGAALLLEGGRILTVGEFLAGVAAVERALDGAAEVINLCEGRAAFLSLFVAALRTRCTTLLPPSRALDAVQALHRRHPGSRTLADDVLVGTAGAPAGAPGADLLAALEAPEQYLAMIGFTSGSTGEPSSHAKYWGSMLASTRLSGAAIRAALPPEQRSAMPWIVGTVPSQHMYGLELTVLLPLLEHMGLHGARPLLPSDVAAALEQTPSPRVLVSTPAHLRAIVAAGVALPRVEVTVSATAPLDAALAREVEAATGGVLLEVFGSTETCILGHRRTAQDARWTPYPGVRFTPTGATTQVSAPWFRAPEHLQDAIAVGSDGRFALLGRSSDLIDVAGKRASLADLTQRVLCVPGVIDAVVFQPETTRGLVRRVAALVVAPGLTPNDVRAGLGPSIDPVFMPRPLCMMVSLPRNAAGKLPRAALESALAKATGGG